MKVEKRDKPRKGRLEEEERGDKRSVSGWDKQEARQQLAGCVEPCRSSFLVYNQKPQPSSSARDVCWPQKWKSTGMYLLSKSHLLSGFFFLL